MARQIFVNLAVKDLHRSKTFFTALGFRFEPKYSGESGAGMIVGNDSYVMLLTESFFQTFIEKELCDARKSTEVLVCLSCASRAEVDEIAAKAVAAGGKLQRSAQDQGFMYGNAFEDLDGHIWELVYMERAP